MPTDNYDASLVVARLQAATLAAYKKSVETYANTVNYNIQRKQQPTQQSGQFVVMAAQTGCVCDTSLPGYTRRIVGLTGNNASTDNDGDYDLYNPIYENDDINAENAQ
jgi:hypothetical protein